MADEQLRQVKTGPKPISKKKNEKIAEAVKKTEESIVKKNEAKDEIKKNEVENGNKKEIKTDNQKVERKKKVKAENKHEAKVYGRALPISLKKSKGIGKFIKHKTMDRAIEDLELVLKKKIAIPLVGEIPHKKGKRMMSGSYPVNASKHFIKLLKSLNGNSVMNGLEIEKTRIREVICNKAPDQMHRGGAMKFKRTHVMIKVSDLRKK
jgi:large subunit ribosomal protein L22